MKPISLIALFMLFPLSALAADAERTADKARAPGAVVQKVEGESPFKRLMEEMWAKLRSYGPRLSTTDAGRTTQVAGVRGAESTASQLKPYWKGDRANDPAYAQEVDAFNKAQELADAGDMPQSAKAFDDFLKSYPKSTLKPNAQFGAGLSHGASGQKDKGLAALNGFIKDNPKHPLVPEAQRLIAELQK